MRPFQSKFAAHKQSPAQRDISMPVWESVDQGTRIKTSTGSIAGSFQFEVLQVCILKMMEFILKPMEFLLKSDDFYWKMMILL